MNLAELSAETEAAERRILAGALDRLEVVRAELDKLRPRILTDREAGDLYRELTAEQGVLAVVIARSRQVLGTPR